MNFLNLTTLLIRKSAKSLQLVLNEWSKLDTNIGSVTASAFSQARNKYRHQAFIELNRDCILSEYYKNKSYKKYLDFRLLAIDCTYLRLPDSESCSKEFGKIKIHNNGKGKDSFIHARSSVLYDVLNDICIDGTIDSREISERDLARRHYNHISNEDLLIFDRGYPGYHFLAELLVKKSNFVARCSSVFSKKIKFKANEVSTIVELKKNKYAKSKEKIDCPDTIKLRAIKVKLESGEEEILVTSLIDSENYPASIFKEIYGLRWQVETMFKVLKSRLTLENFTGKTAESVKQDFYATLFVSNLETVLTEDLDEEISKQVIENKSKNGQKVNKAVSFNVIRDRAFELLVSDKDLDNLLEELSAFMLLNRTAIRKKRIHPKRVKDYKRGRDPKVHFHRNVSKVNF